MISTSTYIIKACVTETEKEKFVKPRIAIWCARWMENEIKVMLEFLVELITLSRKRFLNVL